MRVECLFMGRNKEFSERKLLTLPEGTAGRIDAVLRPGEDAMSFIREATFEKLRQREDIEAEIERRVRARLSGAD